VLDNRDAAVAARPSAFDFPIPVSSSQWWWFLFRITLSINIYKRTCICPAAGTFAGCARTIGGFASDFRSVCAMSVCCRDHESLVVLIIFKK